MEVHRVSKEEEEEGKEATRQRIGGVLEAREREMVAEAERKRRRCGSVWACCWRSEAAWCG
jgi:hypothetical protein